MSVRRSTLLPGKKQTSPAVSLACCHTRRGSGSLGDRSVCLFYLATQNSIILLFLHVSRLPSSAPLHRHRPPPFSRCPISAAKSHQGRLGLLGKVLSGADSRGGRREERCAGVMRGRRVNWRETGSSCGGGGFNTNTRRSTVLRRVCR